MGPVLNILVIITSANSEGSGEPAHMRSLARAFSACILEVWIYMKAQTKIYTTSFISSLDMSTWVFIRGIQTYAIKTEILCTGPYAFLVELLWVGIYMRCSSVFYLVYSREDCIVRVVLKNIQYSRILLTQKRMLIILKIYILG